MTLQHSIKTAAENSHVVLQKIILGTLVALTIFAFYFSQARADENLKPSKQMTEMVREILLKNPEIVVEALQVFEAKKREAEHQAVQKTLAEDGKDVFAHPDDPVAGNPSGDITLVEFFDYRCAYCKRVHKTVQKLIKEDGGLKYVFKEFPILGPASTFAARAALAARPQGKYVPFSNALMEAKGSYSEGQVFGIAKDVGINVKALKKEMKDNLEAIDQVIDRNIKLAQKLNITGTPAFIVGGTVIRGAVSYDTLKMVISDARDFKEKGMPK
ncbi:MAG: DsbA family protein [Alphaproteobacteria bacterium]|nr:DsbA family protein [Rhodospirillales bacterium]MCW9046262.1 DsbA family protein [Alphaproteobacteria bacterium]